MSCMPHISQKIRMENLELVRKLIAKTNNNGARDRELKAVLCTTYGFHPKTVNQYLTDLLESGKICWDDENRVWRLP